MISNDDILTTQSIKAIISHDDVKKIIFENYGFEILKISDLNGYDDKNFKIKVKNQNGCEDGYVFKVINTLDSKKIEFFEAQDSVLEKLGHNGVCCPKPVKDKNGHYLALKKLESGDHIVKLLEYIPGIILEKIESTPMICYECGAFVAKLNNILKDFSHGGYQDRNTPWMLKNVPDLSKFLFAVNSEQQKLVREVIQVFETKVLTISKKFDTGLIHGDFNEQNILVEQKNGRWHVKGVLDFGDSHIGCFLYDLAITMMYVILHAKNLDSGGYVLAGYCSVRKLTSEETQLLKVCVCARMCQSLVLGAFTLSRDPENTYVARTSKFGWEMLEKLWKIPDDLIIDRWINIRDNYVPDNN